MSLTIASCCAVPPPLPLEGGGAAGAPVQSPVQAPVQGGGGAPGQSPMQVPLQPAAVQGASGGGALAQPEATAVAQGQDESITGGGPADMQAIVPVLQQVVEALTALVGLLQAQAGAAGVEGGGAAAAPDGCGCGGSMDAAQGAAQGAMGAPAAASGFAPLTVTAAAAPSGGGALDAGDLTVKGKAMSATQRTNIETVLRVGKDMGANQKVLETAVSTMIQESNALNDASVDSKDHDSLGLFQQRPSQGWGTRAQISDPGYAARKFFEKAIPNDQKNPSLAKTRLAQSVQISAYPDAYAKWDSEATRIVADFLS